MAEIIQALRRSVFSLKQGKVWFYIGIPTLAAVFVMALLSITLLGYLIAELIEYPPMSWLNVWGAFWAAKILAMLGGWLAIISVCYLLAMMLTAILTLPLLLDFLASTNYPDLARLGRDSTAASIWNGLSGSFLFVVGWLVTLPLWLVPGFSLILPFFWMAWLNRRTFSCDILTVFATPEEWRELWKKEATTLLGLGVVTAALTLVPFVGLLSPSLSALAYSHFCLEALRRLRNGAVASV